MRNKKIIIILSVFAVLIASLNIIIFINNNKHERIEGLNEEKYKVIRDENTQDIIEVIVDGYTEEISTEKRTYLNENGEAVGPILFDRSQIKVQDIVYENYLVGDEYFPVEPGDFERVNFIYNKEDDCLYNYDQVYTELASVKTLPDLSMGVKDSSGKTMKLCERNAGGAATNQEGLLKVLYIFGNDNLKMVDLSNYDLSEYEAIELFNTENIEYIDIGNYYPTVVKESGWSKPTVHLFSGIDDTSSIKEINVDNLEMAKWVKKELPQDCVVKVKGEPVELEYIISGV